MVQKLKFILIIISIFLFYSRGSKFISAAPVECNSKCSAIYYFCLNLSTAFKGFFKCLQEEQMCKADCDPAYYTKKDSSINEDNFLT